MPEDILSGLNTRTDAPAPIPVRQPVTEEAPKDEFEWTTDDAMLMVATGKLPERYVAPMRQPYNDQVGEQHMVPNAMRAFRDDGGIDMDFINTMDMSRLDKELPTIASGYDIPDHMKLEILQSVNEQDYYYRVGRATERLQQEKDLEALGGARATMIKIGSIISDPAMFAIDAVSGFSSKGLLLKRLATGGATAGLGAVAIEAVLAADGEHEDPADIAAVVGLSFALGGAFGGLLGRRPDKLVKEATESMDGALRKADEIGEGTFGSDSAGAARVSSNGQVNPELTPDINEIRTERFGRLKNDATKSGLGYLKMRFDWAASFMKRANENLAQLEIGSRLLPKTIASKKGQVIEMAGLEKSEMYFNKIETDLRRGVQPVFQAWVKSTTGRGQWKQVMHESFKGGKQLSLEESFNEQINVVRRANMDNEQQHRSLYRQSVEDARAADLPDPEYIELTPLTHSDIAPEIVEAATHYKAAFQRMDRDLTDMDIKRGIERNTKVLAEGERPSINSLMPETTEYLPRRISHRKVAEQFDRIRNGKAAFEELYFLAIQKGRKLEGLKNDDVISRAVARALTNRGVDPHSGHSKMLDVDALADADRDFILDLLDEGGLDQSDIDEVTGLLDKQTATKSGSKADADNPVRLKHKIVMDMSMTHEAMGKDGNMMTLRVDDLYDSNQDDLFTEYTRWAAGEVGYKHAGMSSQQMRKLIKEAEGEALDNDNGASTRNEGHLFNKKQIEDLQWLDDRMMGRSINRGHNQELVRASRIANSIGFVTKMGSSWYNAFSEGGSALAYSSFKNIYKRSASYGDIIRDMRGKKTKDKLGRQLAMMDSGLAETMQRQTFSSRHQASEVVQRSADGGTLGQRTAGRLDDTMEGLKKGSSKVNMLGAWTDGTRKFAEYQLIEMLDSVLYRGDKAPSWFKDRMASWSIDDARMTKLSEYFNSGAMKRNGKDMMTDFGDMPEETVEIMEDLMFRYTGEVIQHVNEGVLPKWMQANPIMRTMSQFRSFTAAAWVKHTLKDIQHHDTVAAEKMLYTGTMASLAYMGRTWLNHSGTAEYDKRMTSENIMKAGANYAVNVSLIPAMIDTVAPLFGAEPPLAQARTSGLQNAFATIDGAETPIGKWLKDVGVTWGIGMDQVRSIGSGKGFAQPTKSQLRSLMNTSMTQTLWFMKPIEERFIDFAGANKKDIDSFNVWEATGLKDK